MYIEMTAKEAIEYAEKNPNVTFLVAKKSLETDEVVEFIKKNKEEYENIVNCQLA